MIDAKSLSKRLSSIRGRLAVKNLDCLVITKPANVTYVTGFMGDDSWAVITRRLVYLVTDSRYTEQAHSECPCCRVIERTGPMAEAVAEILTKRRIEAASVESSISAADLDRLRKASRMRLRTVADVVEAARAVKDSDEIAAIGKACNLAAAAFEKTRPAIRAGMTESELAGMLELYIRREGAGAAFDTIVAFGPNASRPHHRPGTRKLKKNDTVLIDFGVRWAGYNSDLTRCFELGRPNRSFRRLFGVVEKAQAAAISMIRRGMALREVDEAARRVIRSSGLPLYGHGTGHGLGLEVHEGPVLAARSTARLEAGNVVTVEPGVYLPGEIGIRIEDDVLVTEAGHRILSRKFRH